MLGNSKDIRTKPISGGSNLRKWLSENDVTILDIKYVITDTMTEKYLVIYTKKNLKSSGYL